MFSTNRSASIFESRSGLPCSRVSKEATSSRCCRASAAPFIRICVRFCGRVSAQPRNAAWAASIACRVSSTPACGTVSTRSPVEGSWMFTVAPERADAGLPSITIVLMCCSSSKCRCELDFRVHNRREIPPPYQTGGIDGASDHLGQGCVGHQGAGGVALIHLNRPPANSYDRQFIDDLNAAIDEIRFDEVIGAVVLMSDLPKLFSAGADIGMFRSVTAKARAMTILHMHEVLLKMEHTPKVFIAAIGG